MTEEVDQRYVLPEKWEQTPSEQRSPELNPEKPEEQEEAKPVEHGTSSG